MADIPRDSPSDSTDGLLLDEVLVQLAEKIDAGEPIDVERCCSEHPEHAERLLRVLPTMAALAELGNSTSGT